MGTSTAVLLVASASVAIIHAILPDHWVPIALVARADRWPLRRTAWTGLWTGVGHVVGSLILGVLAIGLGIGFKGLVQWETPAVGIVLIATGLGFFLWSRNHHLTPHSHTHSHSHSHEHFHFIGGGRGGLTRHGHGENRDLPHSHSKIAWLIPVGIAASPDLAILPVGVAAATVGLDLAIQVVILYVVVSIGSMVAFTVGAAWGGYHIQWPWLEQHASDITALVLILLGLVAWASMA